jgi:hypothetical protein
MGLLRQQDVWWGFAAISRSRKSPHNEICPKPTEEEGEEEEDFFRWVAAAAILYL